MQNKSEEILLCCICKVTNALCPDFMLVSDPISEDKKGKFIIMVISHFLKSLGNSESTIVLRSQHICNLCVQELNEYDDAVEKLESIQERLKHLISMSKDVENNIKIDQETEDEDIIRMEQSDLTEQFFSNEIKEYNDDGLSDYLVEITDIADIIEETGEFSAENDEIDVEFDPEPRSEPRLSPLNEEVVSVENDTGNSEHFKTRCPKCNKVFFNKIRYKDHVEFEHRRDVNVLVCRVCHKLFRSLEYLELHMNVHEGKTEKQCRYCDKTYTKKENVLRHMQRHWHKNLQCEICGESFPNKNSLSNHKALHEIECGPIECEICTQTFKNKRTLKTHMLTHDKDRTRYKCSFCFKSFTEKYRLKIHIQSQHSTTKE